MDLINNYDRRQLFLIVQAEYMLLNSQEYGASLSFGLEIHGDGE